MGNCTVGGGGACWDWCPQRHGLQNHRRVEFLRLLRWLFPILFQFSRLVRWLFVVFFFT